MEGRIVLGRKEIRRAWVMRDTRMSMIPIARRCYSRWRTSQSAGKRYINCQEPEGSVLEELGIESIVATAPQAKGRIARRFGVLQDRLIPEMSLAKIQHMATANLWRRDHEIDRYNSRFAKKAAEPGSPFTLISREQISHSVGFADDAHGANDNCVRLGCLMMDTPLARRADVMQKERSWYDNIRTAHGPFGWGNRRSLNMWPPTSECPSDFGRDRAANSMERPRGPSKSTSLQDPPLRKRGHIDLA